MHTEDARPLRVHVLISRRPHGAGSGCLAHSAGDGPRAGRTQRLSLTETRLVLTLEIGAGGEGKGAWMDVGWSPGSLYCLCDPGRLSWPH